MDEFDAIEASFAAYAELLVGDPATRFEALRGCSFFNPVPDESLQRICALVEIKTFGSDVCLTEQDDEAKAFHVILRGSAEAYRNGKLVGTIETGECFGEGMFFTGGGATASATVIADYKIIAATFSKAVVESLQADAGVMAGLNQALLLALFKKLNGANKKIEALLLRSGIAKE